MSSEEKPGMFAPRSTATVALIVCGILGFIVLELWLFALVLIF